VQKIIGGDKHWINAMCRNGLTYWNWLISIYIYDRTSPKKREHKGRDGMPAPWNAKNISLGGYKDFWSRLNFVYDLECSLRRGWSISWEPQGWAIGESESLEHSWRLAWKTSSCTQKISRQFKVYSRLYAKQTNRPDQPNRPARPTTRPAGKPNQPNRSEKAGRPKRPEGARISQKLIWVGPCRL